MSLILVCLSLLLILEVSYTGLVSILNGVLVYNLLQFLVTAIPMTYPRWFGVLGNHPSDGLQLLRLLRSNN
ncbi:hypothetical protein [Alkalibacillus silvisoli]|uniref:Uncharacterized protein n=1 Tax=Alkalibacillus silvisoli TaxID=392823 RepID=A0ABP3JZP4_9BACI